MLIVNKLSFAYQDEHLFQDLSFHLEEGGLLHLRGANGAGKTTLLRILAGLFYPLEGEVLFQGQNIHQDLSVYQAKINYLGHKMGVHPLLTLKENLLYAVKMPEVEAVEELIQQWGLSAHADMPTAHLSAGQKRKLSLIGLQLSKAALWLLDEPLVALDEVALNRLMQLIRQHREDGGAVLMTSHQTLPESVGEYREFCL